MNNLLTVDKMGQQLVSCNKNCEGITNDKNGGVPPRCLLLENLGNKNKLDVIVVGINPGQAKNHEKEFYLDNTPIKYDVIKRAFYDEIKEGYKKIKNLAYFERTRQFINQVKKELDISGSPSILWTDLCKCENRKKNIRPPLQTFRTCIKRFFERELKEFPDIPILALGNQAFQAVSYRFPDRFVIGIPHPSGSRNFRELFVKGKLKEKYKKVLRKTKKHECIKLFPKNIT